MSFLTIAVDTTELEKRVARATVALPATLDRFVRRGANEFAKAERLEAPKLLSTLAISIREHKNGVADYSVGPNTKYAAAVNNGGRPHWAPLAPLMDYLRAKRVKDPQELRARQGPAALHRGARHQGQPVRAAHPEQDGRARARPAARGRAHGHQPGIPMNPQTPESKILATFKAALAAAYPLRTVTRSLKDYAERKSAELKAGVFTIVTVGQPGADVYEQTLKFMVVGQLQVSESAGGEAVEEAELLMAREVKTLIQRQLRGPLMRITGIEHSAQLEVPYGWVSLAVECGPYDATEPLTSDEAMGHLADFLTFRADLDTGLPHQGAAEHDKWARDAPDYTTSKPDAQLRVDIPRSPP